MKLDGKNIYFSFLKGKSFEPKGEFDATAIYQSTSQIVDCVFFNGTSYYCKKTTTAGILPTNTEYWGVLASQGKQGLKGDKGDKGEQGIQGIQGEQGEQGIQGEKGEQGEQGIQGEKGEKGEKGETGAGCYVNGVATNVNFSSDPQTQINSKAKIDASNLTNAEVLSWITKLDILNQIYPVNSYYICKTGTSSPASKYGGNWTRVATNVVLPLGSTAPLNTTQSAYYVGGNICLGSLENTTDTANPVITTHLNSGGLLEAKSSAQGTSWHAMINTTNLQTNLANSTNAISGVDVWLRES